MNLQKQRYTNANHLYKKQADEKGQELIFGFLQGIHDELETLWERYMATIGSRIEILESNTPFLMYWPINHEYFTIYTNNAFFIGSIKDTDLRKRIVTVYTKARGLIDTYRFNNELVYKYEQATFLYQETQHKTHQEQANVHLQRLIKYAEPLQQSHNDVKNEVTILLRELQKLGVLSK